MNVPKSILVVEDDDLTAEIMAVAVRGPGDCVRIVGSMEAARAALNRCPADVVLLDLTLPDSSSMRTLSAIAEMKAGGAKSVIIVTGSPVDDRLMQAGIDAGAIDVIGKDVDLKRRLESLPI